MSTDHNRRVALALETAIKGGSIALFIDGVLVEALSGTANISKAEELTTSIGRILQRASVDRGEISLIAVSNGPGSYTGERIGIATAIGLGAALSIPVVGVDLLLSMRHACSDRGSVVTAVPVGREDVAWADHHSQESETVVLSHSIGSVSEFYSNHRASAPKTIIVHEDLYQSAIMELLEKTETTDDSIINAGSDLARYVGLEALSAKALDAPRPLYLLNRSRSAGLF